MKASFAKRIVCKLLAQRPVLPDDHPFGGTQTLRPPFWLGVTFLERFRKFLTEYAGFGIKRVHSLRKLDLADVEST